MNTFAQDIQDSLCQLTGELLLQSGYVSRKQLEAAFAEQGREYDLIGQILIRQGVLSADQLAEVLGTQLKQKLSVSAPLRRQIGELLLARHAVSRWQLAKALAVQSQFDQNSLKVGEILVDLGFTSRGSIEDALSEQTQTAEKSACGTCCQHKRRTLGELLLQANKVTPEVLEKALYKQQKSHAFLGEVLLSEGILSEGELEDTLAIQLLLQEVSHQLKPVNKRLGEILVDTHQITAQQLEAVVQEQQKQPLHRKLGDLLLEKGLLPLKELKRALRLQKRLATLTMVSLMGATLLSACGTPRVPEQILNTQRLAQLQTQSIMGTGSVGLHVPFSKDFRVLQVESGSKIRIDKNGSRIIDAVPFLRQGKDNTCGQAVMTAILQFWGSDLEYQEVVNMANPRNLPTTDYGLTNFLRSQGLQAQPFRGATVENLIAEVNKGNPTPVLLDFGGISQEHYVIVLGYNLEKNTLIMHDSLEGPHVEMDISTFETMWQNRSIRQVHIFGGENYRNFMLKVSR